MEFLFWLFHSSTVYSGMLFVHILQSPHLQHSNCKIVLFPVSLKHKGKSFKTQPQPNLTITIPKLSTFTWALYYNFNVENRVSYELLYADWRITIHNTAIYYDNLQDRWVPASTCQPMDLLVMSLSVLSSPLWTDWIWNLISAFLLGIAISVTP